MIEGFRIGHHTADGDGWLTGTTVIWAPEGAVGGVDVRGGGPGTRETDLLAPTAMVERVDAVVLTGGSAYGLAAADGVMGELATARRGFRVGPEPEHVVPIVPAAVIFDLGRGGEFTNRPTAEFGARALAAASPADPEQGCVGAGTGAVCGGLKGGFGYAETVVGDGRVGAAVVVNGAGSAVDSQTGRLWADREHRLPQPGEQQHTRLREAARAAAPSFNTTIGVVLTDVVVTKSQATKVAAVAHDGLARAVRPAHGMTDGDTVFCLSSGRVAVDDDPLTRLTAINGILAAAADVFTDACLAALLAATTRGTFAAYGDVVPQTPQR